MSENTACDCDCLCHLPDHQREYRVMDGADVEGISIREVAYDEEGNIIGWTNPLYIPCGTVDELREMLEFDLKDLQAMLAAMDKPVLDEQQLEAQLKQKDEGKVS